MVETESDAGTTTLPRRLRVNRNCVESGNPCTPDIVRLILREVMPNICSKLRMLLARASASTFTP